MAAANKDGRRVQLFNFSPQVLSPAVKPGHDGPLAQLGKEHYAFVKAIPHKAPRTPLFTVDVDRKTFVNVDEALSHLHFENGVLTGMNPVALYSLVAFLRHSGEEGRPKGLKWLDKTTEVSSVTRKKLLERVDGELGKLVELPYWCGSLAGCAVGTTLNRVVPAKFKRSKNCAIKGCTKPSVAGGLCADHHEWRLGLPVDCTKVLAAHPFLTEPGWIYTLLGWPGVYLDGSLPFEGAEARGRLVAYKFFDDVFTLLTGLNANYGRSVDALTRIVCTGRCAPTIMVRMVNAMMPLTAARSVMARANFTEMVANLQLWGFGHYTPGHGYLALKPSQFMADTAGEHGARLTHVNYRGLDYLVNGIFAHCVRRLYSSRFTFRVCAGRIPPGTYEHTIDAAAPDTVFAANFAPSEAVLVTNAEMLTMGLLAEISKLPCSVTFAGSLVAACGGFKAAATRQLTGFVWHVVFMASRSSLCPNGVYDETGKVDHSDESLRRNIVPFAVNQIEGKNYDTLTLVNQSLQNDFRADPIAEKRIYDGRTREAASYEFTKRRETLFELVGLIVSSAQEPAAGHKRTAAGDKKD